MAVELYNADRKCKISDILNSELGIIGSESLTRKELNTCDL